MQFEYDNKNRPYHQENPLYIKSQFLRHYNTSSYSDSKQETYTLSSNHKGWECMTFMTCDWHFAMECDKQCRVIYFCEAGQPLHVASNYIPQWHAYTVLDEEQISGFKWKKFTN
eukprot:5084502-Karenia_brevis.AAC.1